MRKQMLDHRTAAAALTALALLAFASSATAQVQSRASVRANGMGGAFAAVSNDVNGLQFSPAGMLNSFDRWQIELSRHQLFTNLPGENLALNSAGGMYNVPKVYPSQDKLRPVLAENSAFVLTSPDVDIAPDTLRHRFSFGAQWLSLLLPGSLTQNTFMLSAGIGLLPQRDEEITSWQGNPQIPNLISFAVSGRYIRFGYDDAYLRDAQQVNDPAELAEINSFLDANTVAVNDFAIDASVFFFLSRKLQFAASALNLRQPNLAAKPGEGAARSSEGLLGRQYRVGLAYRLFENFVAAADVEQNETLGEVNLYAGAEYAWRNKAVPIVLRAGVNRNWISGGASLPLEKFIRQNFILHGVYQHNLHGDAFTNFRFAIGYGWR